MIVHIYGVWLDWIHVYRTHIPQNESINSQFDIINISDHKVDWIKKSLEDVFKLLTL